MAVKRTVRERCERCNQIQVEIRGTRLSYSHNCPQAPPGPPASPRSYALGEVIFTPDLTLWDEIPYHAPADARQGDAVLHPGVESAKVAPFIWLIVDDRLDLMAVPWDEGYKPLSDLVPQGWKLIRRKRTAERPANRLRPLEAWLERVGARQLWTFNFARPLDVTCYAIGTGTAIVVKHPDNHGWEIYVPASNKNDTALTLDGAATALGVEGSAGLLDPK